MFGCAGDACPNGSRTSAACLVHLLGKKMNQFKRGGAGPVCRERSGADRSSPAARHIPGMSARPSDQTRVTEQSGDMNLLIGSFPQMHCHRDRRGDVNDRQRRPPDPCLQIGDVALPGIGLRQSGHRFNRWAPRRLRQQGNRPAGFLEERDHHLRRNHPIAKTTAHLPVELLHLLPWLGQVARPDQLWGRCPGRLDFGACLKVYPAQCRMARVHGRLVHETLGPGKHGQQGGACFIDFARLEFDANFDHATPDQFAISVPTTPTSQPTLYCNLRYGPLSSGLRERKS